MISTKTGHTGPAPGDIAARLLTVKPQAKPVATPAPHELNGGSTPELEAKAAQAVATANVAGSCLSAALSYARDRSWAVFPAKLSDGEKKSHKSAEHSNGVNWGATKDAAQIRKDFKRWPDAGIGLPTGVDNGIWVIEADTVKGHGVDGLANLAELVRQHGKLSDTLMVESPSGSVHRYYRHPGGNVRIKSSNSVLAPGVDVKGDGAMVIAPQSKRGDGQYRWLNDLPIVDAPDWLLKLVLEPAAPRSNVVDFPLPKRPSKSEHFAAEYQAEIGAVDDKPPLDAIPVLKACPFFANAALTGGKGHNQGLWMQVALATTFMEHGREVFHGLSKGDPRYEPGIVDAMFDRKVNDRQEKDIGYPQCQTFENYGSKQCATCPHKNKIKSPLNLPVAAEGTTAARAPATLQLPNKLMQTSGEFVRNYVPPEYLIDGFLQRRFLYSFTAPTGSGKTAVVLLIALHVARGLPLAGMEVENGRVLIFVGENPEDVRSRWIKLCEVHNFDPDNLDVVFMPFTVNLSAETIRKQIDDEAAEHGPFSLLIVDTSAAYYSGDDENDNVSLGKHAALLRTFVNLPGGPTVLVTCHPVKNPDMANLLPRGGGAFLAAVDGNLVGIKDPNMMTVEITTHGKFRGPEFAPFSFRFVTSTSDKLIDAKGRRTWTVYAEEISTAEQEALEQQGLENQNDLLRIMFEFPDEPLSSWAERLGWEMGDGRPHKMRIRRALKILQKAKFAEQVRDGAPYTLTTKGNTAAKQLSGQSPTKKKTKSKEAEPEETEAPDKEAEVFRRRQRAADRKSGKVKQTKTGSSWYATIRGGLLGRNGKPTWFRTADAAQAALDQFITDDRNSEWELIREDKPELSAEELAEIKRDLENEKE